MPLRGCPVIDMFHSIAFRRISSGVASIAIALTPLLAAPNAVAEEQVNLGWRLGWRLHDISYAIAALQERAVPGWPAGLLRHYDVWLMLLARWRNRVKRVLEILLRLAQGWARRLRHIQKGVG